MQKTPTLTDVGVTPRIPPLFAAAALVAPVAPVGVADGAPPLGAAGVVDSLPPPAVPPAVYDGGPANAAPVVASERAAIATVSEDPGAAPDAIAPPLPSAAA